MEINNETLRIFLLGYFVILFVGWWIFAIIEAIRSDDDDDHPEVGL